MSAGSVTIVLDRLAFEPGETLRGSYKLATPELTRLKEVEITVGWHTEGKGRKARCVEHREVREAGEGGAVEGKFSAVLPPTPLSYDGVLIKVRWAVRVRASFSDAGQLRSEKVFQLGHVAPVD